MRRTVSKKLAAALTVAALSFGSLAVGAVPAAAFTNTYCGHGVHGDSDGISIWQYSYTQYGYHIHHINHYNSSGAYLHDTNWAC